MTSLRSGLIRLAQTNPDLRPHLLPLLRGKESGGNFPFPKELERTFAGLDASQSWQLIREIVLNGITEANLREMVLEEAALHSNQFLWRLMGVVQKHGVISLAVEAKRKLGLLKF